MSNFDPSTITAANAGDGFFVGTEAGKTPEQIRQEQAAITAAQRGEQYPPQQPQQQVVQQPQGRLFTEEEVNKIREDEKNKLYSTIEELKASVEKVAADREAEVAAARAEAEAAAEEARKKAEEEMDLRQLLDTRDAEWTERFKTVEERAAQAEAIVEMERKYQALEQYKANKLQAVGDGIIPDLLAYVGGNDEAEIDRSIEEAIQRSNSILGAIRQSQQQQAQQMRGASVTAPAAGPMENQMEQQPVSAADIRNQDMAWYARNRGQLLRASSQQFNGRRG